MSSPSKSFVGRLPLRSKLALVFAIVSALTFGLGGRLVSSTTSGVLEREILSRLEFQSRAYATALDAHLELLARRVEDFASDGFIRDQAEHLLGVGPATGIETATDSAALRAHLLSNKLPLEPAFFDLSLFAPDGELLCDAHGATASTRALPATSRLGGGTARVSDLLSPPGADGAARFAVATPLTSRDGAQALGHLVAWVRPGVWIVEALRSAELGAADGPGRVSLRLIDRSGTMLVVHPSLTDGLSPTEGAAPPDGRPSRPSQELLASGFGVELVRRSSALSDPESLVTERGEALRSQGFAQEFPLTTSGWRARVELRDLDPYAAVAGLQSRFLGIAALLSLGACVLFLLPMGFVTRPLLQLTSAARRLASGDLTARVPAEGRDELGQLAYAFNSMAAAVAERTAQLQRSADDLRARQAELRTERDRLKAVLAAMREGLVVLNARGEVVEQNRAAGPILQVLRSPDSPLAPHNLCQGAERGPGACHECLFSRDQAPRSCVVEMHGGVYELHATRLAPDASGQSGRLIVSHDLTNRIEQDERQIHHERLAVLGEVAAVMAHELNNPLAAISMYNQMLAADAPAESEQADCSRVIQRNVESCKRAIRELLDYAGDSSPVIETFDVCAVLEDVAAFLRPIRERSGVELELLARDALAPDAELLVKGDEIQVRQVFVNLAVNAIQAVGRGGRITLAVRRDEGHAVVDVTDTGPGVEPDLRESIFRPFFTTKDRGEGTGLGLSTSRRIAQMHGGSLELAATGPEGSTFRVRLGLEQQEVAV